MLALLAACSQVQPWERGYLAKQEMAWDSDPLERALNDHIFFSKEASQAATLRPAAVAAATGFQGSPAFRHEVTL